MDVSSNASPTLWFPVDGADAEYLVGRSEELLAAIQVAKAKISHIEYVFYEQLYPKFQSKSRSLQTIYSEAKKVAEDEWKEKEQDLLLQIETLQFQKQHLLEENQHLKLFSSPKCVDELQEELKQKTREIAEGREVIQNLCKLIESKACAIPINEKKVKELEEEVELIRKKKRSVDLENEELRFDLMKKSKQVDEGMEMHVKLQELVQSKDALILLKEKELEENKENESELLVKLKVLTNEVEVLQKGIKEKTDQAEKAKELQENLYKKIQSQASELVNNRQLMDDYEVENKQLRGQVRTLQDNLNGLQRELPKKIKEVEEERKPRQQLLQQNDSNGSEMLKTRPELEKLQKEKQLLLGKLKGLEGKVEKLEVDLRETNKESAKEMELHGTLLHRIETRDSELLSEKKKRREVVDAYKRLKSQYNYLLGKCGLTPENMLPRTIEDERGSIGNIQNPIFSPGSENKVSNNPRVDCQLTDNNINEQNLEVHKEVKLIQRSSYGSPSTSSPSIAAKPASNMKSSSLAGMKRSASHWRETRSYLNRSGPDPHDDFLDTPLENIRGNVKKIMKDEIHHLPDPAPKDMSFDSSDEETQDLRADVGLQEEQIPPSVPAKKAFKYVEPVRKKADRENLKGVECKQCKKFYDAVLPDDGGNQTNGNKQNLRCEHHDGVSRHRYRYAPPLTPEGFWNIGFESEI